MSNKDYPEYMDIDMRLIPIQEVADAATYLYALLLERDESINISHKAMPSVDKHLAFVRSHPYREWYLIIDDPGVVGAIYLSKQNEVGIFIFKANRGHGYGRQAVEQLIAKHQGERILANISPSNHDSQMFFANLGAKLIQLTYEVPA